VIEMAAQKISNVVIVAITMAGILSTVTAASVIAVNEALPTRGSISSVNVGLYSDSGCTQKLTSIDWGNIPPGGTSTQTIYIKNAGNTQLTLKMTKTNWNPLEANGPITINWDREDTNLNAGQSLQAVITLSVSSTISGNITGFSVDIVITGLKMG
jgi:hypothetical protein